jgi:hypothetical protein
MQPMQPPAIELDGKPIGNGRFPASAWLCWRKALGEP